MLRKKNLKWQTYFLIFIICVICVLLIIRISYTFGEKNHNFNRKIMKKIKLWMKSSQAKYKLMVI